MSTNGPDRAQCKSASEIFLPGAFFNVLTMGESGRVNPNLPVCPEATHLSWGLRPAAFLFVRPSPWRKASVWDPHRGWGGAGGGDYSCWSHQALATLVQCFSCPFVFSSTHLWGQRCLTCSCSTWRERYRRVPTYRLILYHQSSAVFFGVSGKADVAVNRGHKCRWRLRGSGLQPWLCTGVTSSPGPSACLAPITPIPVYVTPVSF